MMWLGPIVYPRLVRCTYLGFFETIGCCGGLRASAWGLLVGDGRLGTLRCLYFDKPIDKYGEMLNLIQDHSKYMNGPH